MEEYYFYTEGLTVGYHGVPLIKNIKISLKKGEILTLIGPNGAGKTTILRSIIKQLKPIGGVVVLDGKETEQISGKELSRKLSVVLTERVRPEMMTCKEAAHLVKTRNLPLCTDIFLQHSYLIRRHIQLIISAILNTQIISANPLNFHSFHAKIFANTMLVVNHIVSHIDFPEMTNAFLTAYSI